MNEPGIEKRPKILTDIEVEERYLFVAEKGRKIFSGSALIDAEKQITERDLELIHEFHREVSPANRKAPYRLTSDVKSIEKGQIVDDSTYANWEAPGGPLEHIGLAMNAARLIAEEVRRHLRNPDEMSDPEIRRVIEELKKINPLHTVAAAGLHDEGREITHQHYTTDLVGRRLLMKIGIREDIRSVIPGEEIMLTPLDQSMDDKIKSLPAEMIILGIADNFGKRSPGTNRLYLPGDFDPQSWANSYTNRPPSGRPSDRRMRETMQLHVANVPRYFKALDNWLKLGTDLSLEDITTMLNQQLSPTLPPLPVNS